MTLDEFSGLLTERYLLKVYLDAGDFGLAGTSFEYLPDFMFFSKDGADQILLPKYAHAPIKAVKALEEREIAVLLARLLEGEWTMDGGFNDEEKQA